jgi:hypothetical protein
MSAKYPGRLSIDRSSSTRQVKRAHPLIGRNAIYQIGGGQWLPSWNVSRCGRNCHGAPVTVPPCFVLFRDVPTLAADASMVPANTALCYRVRRPVRTLFGSAGPAVWVPPAALLFIGLLLFLGRIRVSSARIECAFRMISFEKAPAFQRVHSMQLTRGLLLA